MIITSILDTDLYKLTMGQLVFKHFPTTKVSYKFTNRGTQRFTPEFVARLKSEIQDLSAISLRPEEADYLLGLNFLSPAYITFLSRYRFDPNEVKIDLDADGNLFITIEGLWSRTIMWEVSLMALISQVYFQVVDTSWYGRGMGVYTKQREKAKIKAERLTQAKCKFIDMGTRRRRSLETQHAVLEAFKGQAGFAGTSNVQLAYQYGVPVVGTMAHEYIMGVSALCNMRYVNRDALLLWRVNYDKALQIALTDTYGTDAFLADFDKDLASSYTGVRHDSGSPDIFTNKILLHYEKLGIDPKTKTIVYSDSLDVNEAIRLQNYFGERINIRFGIGTHFTNDFENLDGTPSKALNMVIKLATVDGFPVVKLSDNPTKASGDADAVRVAKWLFHRNPL